jgi:hypothetical protein
MRTILVTLVLVGAAAIASGTVMLPPPQQNALSSIDQVPTKPQLDSVFGTHNDALQGLASIAIDGSDMSGDAVAIRLRAIHALAKYCSTTPCTTNELAHQSVASVIAATRMATSGSDALILRAGIETIGLMKVAGDVSILVPLLEHPSRDIRAATARALRDLCNPVAKNSLSNRYNSEMTLQVRLAISEALRILEQCSN